MCGVSGIVDGVLGGRWTVCIRMQPFRIFVRVSEIPMTHHAELPACQALYGKLSTRHCEIRDPEHTPCHSLKPLKPKP